MNFGDPFGLCNDPAKPECKGLGQQAYESLRNAVGSLVNKISGGLASARDALTGREPGTTQNAVANAVLNPPDIGSVDPSVTLNIGPAALTVRPDALVVGVQPSDELSVTLDATYTLPGQHPGFQASAGAEGSLEGVIVGGSVNTAGGKVTGFTGSLGVGLGAKEKARVDPVLVIPFGTIPF